MKVAITVNSNGWTRTWVMDAEGKTNREVESAVNRAIRERFAIGTVTTSKWEFVV